MSATFRPTALLCVVATLASYLTTNDLFADTVKLPVIAGAAIDGSATSANFGFSITSDTSVSALTTQQVLDLTLLLKPEAADVGRSGTIYVIFVKNNTFFLLNPDSRFTVWNGEVATLFPFAEKVTLGKETAIKLLSGRLDSAGEFQVFIAYGAIGKATLDYTPNPIVLKVGAASQSTLVTEALSIFETNLEKNVIQTRCIACHVTGGLARNSALQFQRTMTGSALNNLSMLQSYLDIKGNSAETLLTKATGGNSHTGGQQIVKDSEDYKVIARVMALLEQDRQQQSAGLAYSFDAKLSGQPITGAPMLLSSVVLEPREDTLRRATILFAGRAPTSAELERVRKGDDAILRSSIRALMSGPLFRKFVVRSSNDRLLTEAAGNEPINTNFGNFPILRTLAYQVQISEEESAWYQKYGARIEDAAQRASGELIAHVIDKELPYSEILTANYMMMTPLLNEMLGGTAVFPAGATDNDFLPARITQYYSPEELVQTEKHPVAGLQVLSRGTPMADYPHAGILTDFGFLARYPTTATNRNRARARWTLYYFLGIDIEKSSQRPTNEAALSDRNNPTLNNPACGVCHTVMDPVAGAFQNWSDFNYYRQNNGTDALDRFYKHPADGSKSLYQPGDLWYRDMRPPGLFEKPLTSRDYTLRELANRIVEEPGFIRAAAVFWWPAVFGSKPVELPSVETDQGFAEKNAAYLAQQTAIDEFASTLANRRNAKDMLVEMVMSPWFSAKTSTNYAFQAVQLEANLGAERLLTPDQIATKTRNLTGVFWRSNATPQGNFSDYYDTLSVLLGGIDSAAVTERATLLTPSMVTILQTHAAETSCPIVVKDFALPPAQRRLFSKVDDVTTPLTIAQTTVNVTSLSSTDWQEHKLAARIPAKGADIRITFVNPFCDWNGVTCLEQRVLYVDAVTLRHSGGSTQRFEVNAPEVKISGEQCYTNNSNATFYSGCTLSLGLNLDAASDMEVIVHLAAQQAPSKPDKVQARIEVVSTENILTSQNPNALLLRQQIVDLFEKLHGKYYAIDSRQVQQTFALFAAALSIAQQSANSDIGTCPTWTDGNFYVDLLTPEQLARARTPSTKGNYYELDWSYVSGLTSKHMQDSAGVKRAWMAVIAYLLGHYDYLHE